MERKIGIIAGTALRELDGLDVTREGMFDTKYFGQVWVIEGTLAGKPVVVIPRHGRYHEHLPHETNFIGNLVAMKLHGVTDVLGVCAMGGLTDEYQPGMLVFPDVTTDKTHGRCSTIFGDGIAGHVARPKAVCPALHNVLVRVAIEYSIPHKPSGNLVVINGPHFDSTQESHIDRQQGHHVKGMNTEPEAKLARELKICYASVGQLTDMDNPPPDSRFRHSVDQQMVTSNLANMAKLASIVILKVVTHRHFSDNPVWGCLCQDSLNGSILTDPRGVTEDARRGFCHIFGLKEIPREWFAAQ